MASIDWRHEMENMLAAFNRQAIHSLSIIKLAFKGSGLSFTPEFKKYFVQASTIRINEAYDQFQVNSMFEDQLSPSLNSVATVAKQSPRNGTNGVECETDDRGNGTSIGSESDWRTFAPDLGCDEVLTEAVETKSTDDKSAVKNGALLNANRNGIESDTVSTQNISDAHNYTDGPVANDALIISYEPIAHQSNTNECSIVDLKDSSDTDFEVEMDESNDFIENQSDSIDAIDSDLIPVKVVLDRSDEMTSADVIESKTKTTRSNHKNPHKNRMTKMGGSTENRDNMVRELRGKKSAAKQLAPKSLKRCTVCGYTAVNITRHMRSHTGEKPYRCDRCGKGFASAANLMKHGTTHIAEFPFHCRACFRGFSLKTEAMTHEEQCQKRHFQCYLCEKFVTFDKAALTRHMRIHSGGKAFCCEICTQHFGRKDNLQRHLKNFHLGVNV